MSHYILYIEDERPIRELVRHALTLAGYEAEGASTGAEGLSMMQERKPDLVLLDLMMPNVNGWDVYKAMKADDNLADVPVIVVTARVPERGKYIVEDLEPVQDYVTKPFDVEKLIRAIETALG